MKYWLSILAAFLVAVAASWTPMASRINGDAYDWMSRLYPVHRPSPQSLILAVDETTLKSRGGLRGLRGLLAATLEEIGKQDPTCVVVDFTLADDGDPAEDARLAAALRSLGNKAILAADLAQDRSGWQEPSARLGAVRVGHVHAEPDPVSRTILVAKAAGRTRHWALALEAFRGDSPVEEEFDHVRVRGVEIPRSVYVRYSDSFLSRPATEPGDVNGKAVFIGATALTAARDRLMTPIGRTMPGIEIHANLYETLREDRFLKPVSSSIELLLYAVLASLAGLIFWRWSSWPAYLAGAAVVGLAHAAPHAAWQADLILPSFGLMAVAWLSVATAATYRYFLTRRELAVSEAGRERYQRAIHWVTHEMRTPLTAIQGSSELMTRYSLPDEKRREITSMINAESKRLARMVQTFLDVERLSAGEMELKREPFVLAELVDACVARARPLAANKEIELSIAGAPPASVTGDRELMEYALYNLITNAIKYSPSRTIVTVGVDAIASTARIWVRDQGMGIDEKDLAKLGTRFFRTRRAEESGIHGTGIGLSIVQEIVAHHHGKLGVTSRVGEGSCFTIEVPAS